MKNEMHEFSFKLKVCKIFGVKTLEIQEISKNLFNNYSLRFFNHRQPVLSENKNKKALNIYSVWIIMHHPLVLTIVCFGEWFENSIYFH